MRNSRSIEGLRSLRASLLIRTLDARLSAPGGIPERSKGRGCKPRGYAFPGSNPGPATGRSERSHVYPRALVESDSDVSQNAIEDAARERAARLSRLRGAATRLDTQPTLLAATRRLRRSLPGDEKFGDPLSTAGMTAVETIARGVSSLQPDRD